LIPAEQLEDQVRQIAGADVEAVQGALAGPVSILRANGVPFETIAVALDEHDPFLALETLDGDEAFTGADGVWIGHNVRRVLDVNVGDTITLRALDQEHEVTIAGVVSYALGSPVFVPRGLMEQWTPGNIFLANTALVRVRDGQAEAVRDALVSLPGMVAVEVSRDFEDDVNHYLMYFRVGALIFGSFGYILTLAVVFNTVNSSLRERLDELSIMRALGSTRLEIAVTVTLELMLMGNIGALIGIPIGREQVNSLSPIWYGIGLLSLTVIVLLAEIPGLRSVQHADLGQVSKSQSF
jgi:putative ABC transport system permease protein